MSIEQEKIKGSEIKKSTFIEKILSRGRDDLKINEYGKNALVQKIELLASLVERSLQLKENEGLVWEIDFIPQLNETELKEKRERAEKESEQMTNKLLGDDYGREKIFGSEFGDEFIDLPMKEQVQRLKPKVVEHIMQNSMEESDLFLRANVTVRRQNKSGENKTTPFYANINLFGDEIIQKQKGRMTIDELAGDIASSLVEK